MNYYDLLTDISYTYDADIVTYKGTASDLFPFYLYYYEKTTP